MRGTSRTDLVRFLELKALNLLGFKHYYFYI